MLLPIIGLFALFMSSCVAFKWGGLDERLAAGAFVMATLASRIATQSDYMHTETGVLAIDTLLLLALVGLALRSDRFWPMWAAGFQLVAVTVHIASTAETGNFAWAYAVGLVFWTYPVLIALMIGTWLEARYRLN